MDLPRLSSSAGRGQHEGDDLRRHRTGSYGISAEEPPGITRVTGSRIGLLRLLGFVVAATYLTAAILGNSLASDEADLMSASDLLLDQLGTLVLALPLLLPWRVFAGRFRWRVLVGWLCFDGLVLTSYEVYKLVWFFEHRPFDIWVMYILTASLLMIAGMWMAVAAALFARGQLDQNSSQARSAG